MNQRLQLPEKFFRLAAWGSAGLSLLILVFMLILGRPLLGHDLFALVFHQPWQPDRQLYGLFPMLVGTLAVSTTALLMALPLAFGTAILAAIIRPGGCGRLLVRIVQLLTGMPTVVYGFVGIFLLVPRLRTLFGGGSGRSILAAALMLALLITPTMVLIFIDSFQRVPRGWQTAAAALGCTPMQTFRHVILPRAAGGLLSGTILAFGRAVGDTMIALMLAGNAVAVPCSLLDPARTLTSQIALVFAADFSSLEFKSIFLCGLILYLLTSTLTIALRLARPTVGYQP
ncbi:MAG: ABC transporter permease subunit [Deltaproteobacteria bacterium]|nr:ABC transporter permease subunit [Deltaproteobacteria bacterium]